MIIRILTIPTIAAEPFISPILPRMDEYASLIELPITGIIELIRYRMLFTLAESAAAETDPFIVKIDAKVPAEKPKIRLIALLNKREIRSGLILLFSENPMERLIKAPMI